MALITIKIPALERAIGSAVAVIRAPAAAINHAMAPMKAVGESMTAALAAFGESLVTIQRKERTK